MGPDYRISMVELFSKRYEQQTVGKFWNGLNVFIIYRIENTYKKYIDQKMSYSNQKIANKLFFTLMTFKTNKLQQK